MEAAASTASAALPHDCAAGRHVVSNHVWTDASGVRHGHCRYCGCELRRLPAIGRWYRSGLMG
jgi:hypothetical protein